jgi:hypothetical protein
MARLPEFSEPAFGELRHREVRRIPLPRTWVNRGIRKGQSCYALA